jgi:hypothetical protein
MLQAAQPSMCMQHSPSLCVHPGGNRGGGALPVFPCQAPQGELQQQQSQPKQGARRAKHALKQTPCLAATLHRGLQQCRADRRTSPETLQDATRLQSSGHAAAPMMLPAAPDAHIHQDTQHTAAWQDWHEASLTATTPFVQGSPAGDNRICNAVLQT